MARLPSLLALCLLASATARAQQPVDERAVQAKQHYEQGMANFQLEEYDAAIKQWEDGFRIKPAPQFLYNIAQAYRLSNRLDRALSFYRKYLNMDPKAPNKTEVDRHIATLGRAIEEQKKASSAPPNQPITTDPPKPKPTVAVTPQPSRTEPPRPVATRTEPPKPVVTRTEPPKPVVSEPPKPVVSEPPRSEPAHADLTASAKPRDDRPITKKGWFWGVIGGVAAVVVAGVVIGVVVGTSGDSTPALPTARF